MRGRPRKTLPGGHKTRRVPPTQNAQLAEVVRTMGKPRAKVAAREPAGREQREERTTKDGKKIYVLKKGHHQGRPPGARNAVPSGIRASVKAILERVVKEKGTTVEQAVVEGLQSGPRHADRYLRLAAEYVDGKPTDHISLNARFNQDELSIAREQLSKKLDTMLRALVKTDGEK